MNKWRDEAGNVYTVEQSARNKRFMVIRTNPGGQPEGGAGSSLGRERRPCAEGIGRVRQDVRLDRGDLMTPKEREFCEKVVVVIVMVLGLLAIGSAVCGMLAR